LTFSDANPVQFWDYNCDTFNEKTVPGIFSRCFCQIFNADDTITVQFYDAVNSNPVMKVLDTDGGILYSAALSEVNNVFTHSFVPSAQGITDQQIQIIVFFQGAQTVLFHSTFDTDLDGWVNEGTGTSWVWDAISNNSAIVDSITDTNSKYLSKSISGAADIYNVQVSSILFSFVANTANVLIEAYNGGTKVATIYDEDHTFSTPEALDLNLFALLPAFTSVKIKYTVSGNSSFLMTSFQMNAFGAGSGAAAAAKSDCIDIKTSHDESVLISYTNNRVFASLNTNIGTPDPEFQLRIPAIFFEESHPEESEVLDLTDNSMVQLNATVKFKKLLQVKMMPQYMHLKTKLVLKMQNVEIDGEQWISVDPYEMGPLAKRHSQRKASCWLTKENYLVRNVL
jgi:hypothetical protein